MKLAALALGLLVPLGAATAAQAAEPVPFTITEQANFAAGVFTFTATGPLCPSGTYADDVKVFAPGKETNGAEGKLNLLIRTVFTCDDGSGTFDALKHVFFTFTDENNFTNTGPIELLGGTGAYTGLVGHGVDNGAGNIEDTGVGQISGFVVQGPGT
jgi:hypothetical protein